MPLTPFPFPPLREGEVTPGPGQGDLQELLQRDVRIVRWFIEERWARTINARSPLGELLAVSEKVDLHGPADRVENIDPEVARHLLHAVATLERLAWAIRALHGREGAIERVDASFIDDELMGADTKQPDAKRTLPGGIGTLVFAGRLVQAGGGHIISVNGHRARGHDIRWVTRCGDTVLVERKDRSYEAGLNDDDDKRVARVIAEVKSAAKVMPREPGAARVLVVGFQHLVRMSEADAVNKGYELALKRVKKGPQRKHLPNLVIIEHLGLEPRTGGDKFDFFAPVLLRPDRRFMDRVARLLVTALGVKSLG